MWKDQFSLYNFFSHSLQTYTSENFTFVLNRFYWQYLLLQEL